jgi:hypothetical protein
MGFCYAQLLRTGKEFQPARVAILKILRVFEVS